MSPLFFPQTQRLDFVFDLYGSTSLSGLFVQGNAYDSVYRFERHIVFPKLLSRNCPDFEASNVMYNADPEKTGTSRRLDKTKAPSKILNQFGFCRYLSETIGGETNVYAIEASMHGFYTEEEKILYPYSEEDCEQILSFSGF